MSGIAAYSGLIGSAINAAASAFGGYMTNAANSRLNEQNMVWNEKMWNLSNQYNLPVNQMQRFKAAGLNPNLIYGDGTSSLSSYAGNLNNTKPAQNPLANTQLDAASIIALKNETKVADAQAESLQAQAFKDEQQGLNTAYENETKPKMLQFALEKAGLEISNLDIENTIKMATQNTQIAKMLTELENLALDRDVKKSEVQIKAQELLNKVQELKNLEYAGEFIQAETDTEKAKASNYNAEASLNIERKATERANQALAKAQSEYYKAGAASQRAGAKMSLSQARYYDELAKNQPYVRRELAAHAKELQASTAALFSSVGVNKQSALKMSAEIQQMVMNGKVDRLGKFLDMELKSHQTYGTGTTGVMLNAILDIYFNVTNQGTKKIQSFKGNTHNHGATTGW